MSRNIKFLEVIDSKGFSQRKTALLAQISESRLSEFVRGYSVPTTDELKRICKVLKCKSNDIGLDAEPVALAVGRVGEL